MKFKGLQKIGSVIENLTQPVFKKHGFANQKIITYWPQIVGNLFAKFTIPQKIVFPPNKTRSGILYIGVTNPALSLELQAQESRIIEKISTFFGYQAVSRIRISHVRLVNRSVEVEPAEKLKATTKEKQNVYSQIKSVEDEELRKRLKKLADTFF